MATATKKSQVIVTYNGTDATVPFNPNGAVQALLAHALNEFGIQSNRHLMSLFTEGGVELADNASASSQGVEPGHLLILRQSTVKGG